MPSTIFAKISVIVWQGPKQPLPASVIYNKLHTIITFISFYWWLWPRLYMQQAPSIRGSNPANISLFKVQQKDSDATPHKNISGDFFWKLLRNVFLPRLYENVSEVNFQKFDWFPSCKKLFLAEHFSMRIGTATS